MEHERLNANEQRNEIAQQVFEILERDTLDVPTLLDSLKRCVQSEDLFSGNGAANILLEVHTTRVLGQFEKYLANSAAQNHNFLRLFLALHDLGKPQSLIEEQPEKEHDYTWGKMTEILDDLKVNENKKHLAQALLAGDPIGEYLQDKITKEEAVDVMQTMARMADVSPREMLNLSLIYFQSDAGSYTAL